MHSLVQFGILPSLSDDSDVQVSIANLTKSTDKHALSFLLREKVDLFDERADALNYLVVVICCERHIVLHREAPGKAGLHDVVTYSPDV